MKLRDPADAWMAGLLEQAYPSCDGYALLDKYWHNGNLDEQKQVIRLCFMYSEKTVRRKVTDQNDK